MYLNIFRNRYKWRSHLCCSCYTYNRLSYTQATDNNMTWARRPTEERIPRAQITNGEKKNKVRRCKKKYNKFETQTMREADEKKFTVFLFRFKETKNDFQKICIYRNKWLAARSVVLGRHHNWKWLKILTMLLRILRNRFPLYIYMKL